MCQPPCERRITLCRRANLSSHSCRANTHTLLPGLTPPKAATLHAAVPEKHAPPGKHRDPQLPCLSLSWQHRWGAAAYHPCSEWPQTFPGALLPCQRARGGRQADPQLTHLGSTAAQRAALACWNRLGRHHRAQGHPPPAHHLASPSGCTTPAASVSPTSSCAAFICTSMCPVRQHARCPPQIPTAESPGKGERGCPTRLAGSLGMQAPTIPASPKAGFMSHSRSDVLDRLHSHARRTRQRAGAGASCCPEHACARLRNQRPQAQDVEHLQVAPRLPPVQLLHIFPEAAK